MFVSSQVFFVLAFDGMFQKDVNTSTKDLWKIFSGISDCLWSLLMRVN